MPSFVYNKCCGCIDLKKGCFIIGYLELVGSIILTIVAILGIVGVAVLKNSHEKTDDQNFEIALESASIFVLVLLAIFLLFVFLFMIFVIVLLVGLHKNKPGHLKAYLIYAVIFLVFNIIEFIANLIGDKDSRKVRGIAQDVFTILLNAYFILIIRSMYYRMKEAASRGPAIYTAAMSP